MPMNPDYLPVSNLEKSRVCLSVDSLAFDDAPIPVQAEGVMSTPVNAVARWQRGESSDGVAVAVAALFLKGEVELNNETFEAVWSSLRCASERCAQTDENAYVAYKDALSKLAEGKGDYQCAESYLREIIRVLQIKCAPDHVDILRAQLRLGTLLEKLGRTQESIELIEKAWFKLLLLEQRSNGDLRKIALTYIVEKDYGKARQIYEHLINNGFELASTYCHLARVCYILKDFKSMCEYADQASKVQDQADAYVIPRILFFLLVGKMLLKQPWEDIVRQINTTLQKPNVNMEWTMLPALEMHRDDFSSENFALLAALIEALNAQDKMKELFALPLWQESIEKAYDVGQPQTSA